MARIPEFVLTIDPDGWPLTLHPDNTSGEPGSTVVLEEIILVGTILLPELRLFGPPLPGNKF